MTTKIIPENTDGLPVTRRHFVQADESLPQGSADSVAANAGADVIATCSTFDCGGKCDIRAHVKEGIDTRVTNLTIHLNIPLLNYITARFSFLM